jgi:hypothetical protein
MRQVRKSTLMGFYPSTLCRKRTASDQIDYDHNEILRRALELVGIELEQTYYEGAALDTFINERMNH